MWDFSMFTKLSQFSIIYTNSPGCVKLEAQTVQNRQKQCLKHCPTKLGLKTVVKSQIAAHKFELG